MGRAAGRSSWQGLLRIWKVERGSSWEARKGAMEARTLLGMRATSSTVSEAVRAIRAVIGVRQGCGWPGSTRDGMSSRRGRTRACGDG